MKIEYKKREVMWCLEREGPGICLRAVIANNQIQSLKITSEDFFLEFDGSEAQGFLDMLLELTKIELPEKEVEGLAITTPTVDLAEPEELLTQDTVSEPEPPEVFDIPDPSEIIEVLKHSEMKSPEENLLSIEESLFETDLTPEVLEESMSETTPISEVQEEPLDEVTPSPDLQESTDETISAPSLSDTIFAAASFFQDTEIKSPLEQLLEEEEEEDKSAFQEIIQLKAEDEEEKTEELPDSATHTPKLFGPDDLKTASFFSDFESQEITETPQQPELEPETKLESEPDSDQQVVQQPVIEPETEPESQKVQMTDTERRAKIKKERAERKKRLWELTRGF